MAVNVTEIDFEQAVVQRSHDVPVVVDFWAEWCGPCRVLGPALEQATGARAGKVELVKVDVDANRTLAARYQIQGIPAVKAFRDGRVVDEFVGALPAAQIERFLDGIVPSEADELVAVGDEASLRRALELQPGHAAAAASLGRMMLQRGEAEGALELLEAVEGDFEAEGVRAQARLLTSGAAADLEDVAAGLEALRGGETEAALESLDAALKVASNGTRDLIRQVMVGMFAELGPDHPLAREYRRRLAAALF